MKWFLFLIVITLFFITACNKKNENSASIQKQIQKKTPFTPPENPVISKDQMVKWLNCNPKLDSLSILYLDSFKTEDTVSRIRYQQNFLKSQDGICVQQGFSGGYDEYLWILKSAGDERNRKVLESLDIKRF